MSMSKVDYENLALAIQDMRFRVKRTCSERGVDTEPTVEILDAIEDFTRGLAAGFKMKNRAFDEAKFYAWTICQVGDTEAIEGVITLERAGLRVCDTFKDVS